MEARIFRFLSVAVVGALMAALLAGSFLPIYTDEIGWRFQERAGFDGVDKMLAEACGPNTMAAPPWFIMPARWYSALFNGAFPDPFWIRVSGVLYALLWVALALLLIRRLTKRDDNRAIMTIMALGLLALGTMPLAMVWSRPEQPIALAAVAALVIAFSDGAMRPAPQSSARQAWMRSLAIWALSCVAVAYHVKGLFLLPLMLGCLFFASRGSRAILARGVATLAVLGTTLSAMIYWRNRMACPDDPILAKASGDVNLSGMIAQVSSFDQAQNLLRQMIENVGIFRYVAGIAPKIDPLSFWLEHGQISKEASFAWFLAICLAWLLVLTPAAILLAVTLFRNLRERELDPRPILAVITVGVAIAWTAVQTVANVYEVNFVLLLVILAVALALASPMSSRFKPWLNVIGIVIGLAALISPVAIAAIYAASFERAARQQGHLAAQPFSISVFGFAKVRQDVRTAAKLCGITDPAKSHAVMVDDVTYLPFIHSDLPEHAFGVVGGWKGQIDDPIAYLKSRDSDGAVVSCRLLPDDLRVRAKQAGKFCCLAPPNW